MENKRNKGFTLIELLAILVILPVLFMIAYPAVRDFLGKTEKQYYDTLEDSIKLSAVDFLADNPSFTPKNLGGYKRITLEQIVKYGEMEQITDHKGKPCDSKEGYVVIEKTGDDKYEYTPCFTCGEYKTDNPKCESNNSKYEVDYVLRHENSSGASYKENTWSSTNIYQEFYHNQLFGVRVDTYQRSIDGGAWQDFSGNSFVLQESHHVCVRAIDIDGNISDAVCYTVKIDKTIVEVKPVFQAHGRVLVSPTLNDLTSTLFTFTPYGPSGVNITCQYGSNVVYQNQSGEITINKKLNEYIKKEGSYTVSCTAKTGAGITRTGSNTVHVIDLKVSYKLSNAKGSYLSGSWSVSNVVSTLSSNVAYNITISTYQRQLDNGSWVNIGGNTFTLGESHHPVCVRAVDMEGNLSDTKCYTVKIDKTVVGITPVSQAHGRLLGSSAMNETFSSMFRFGTFGSSGGVLECKYGSSVVYRNTNGSVTINSAISSLIRSEGNYTVSCSSRTGAGNTASGSNIIDVVNGNEKVFTENGSTKIYASGYYQITSSGAQGSNNGGKGGTIVGSVYLYKGDTINFSIGKVGSGGSGYSGSGGGSTIISKGSTRLLIGAGGGGGSGGGIGGNGNSLGGVTPNAPTNKGSLISQSGGQSGSAGSNGSGGGRSNNRSFVVSCWTGENTCQPGYWDVNCSSCKWGNPNECVGGYVNGNCNRCSCSLYKTCQTEACGWTVVNQYSINFDDSSRGHNTKTDCVLAAGMVNDWACITYRAKTCQNSACGSETIWDCGRCSGKHSFQCHGYEQVWNDCASTKNTCQYGCDQQYDGCKTGHNTCTTGGTTISGVGGQGGTSSVDSGVSKVSQSNGNITGNGVGKIKFLKF